MKALTRRELFSELVSKDTLRQVVNAWYGFTKPLSEELGTMKKQESLLDKVKKLDSKHTKNYGKEG